jgi:hypothetical protein
LDVSFSEDQSRKRDGCADQHFSPLNRIAPNPVLKILINEEAFALKTVFGLFTP